MMRQVEDRVVRDIAALAAIFERIREKGKLILRRMEGVRPRDPRLSIMGRALHEIVMDTSNNPGCGKCEETCKKAMAALVEGG